MSQTPSRITVHENGEANSYALLTDDNKWLLSLLHNGEALVERQRDTMRRLAACWNACDGIDTEELERIASTGGMLGPREDVARIARQRDELLAALRPAHEKLRSHFMELAAKYSGTPYESDAAYQKAQAEYEASKAAIANATKDPA